jgi:hypothetical protein
MINPFLLDTKERLQSWKNIRIRIGNEQDVFEKISLALDFWRGAPIEKSLLDWDDSRNWPSPWELINTNRFCESTLSLGVGYTLVMADPDIFSDVKLILITDRENHVQKIIVATDDYVLNFEWLDCNSRSILRGVDINRRWGYNGKTWKPIT